MDLTGYAAASAELRLGMTELAIAAVLSELRDAPPHEMIRFCGGHFVTVLDVY